MTRTLSTLAAVGLALSGSVALAGAFIPQGGRSDRQPATDDPAPRSAEPRPAAPPAGAPRVERRDDRRNDTRNEGRTDRRTDARIERRDEVRGERSDERRTWREPERRDAGRTDDRGRRDERRPDPRDVRAMPPRSGWNTAPDWNRRGGDRGWRDERGRDWRYSRDWYDHYRADHWRYDRGRYFARDRFTLGLYVLPRGLALRAWQRGQWLPAAYYGERRWHLGDYWRYGLYDPPFDAGWIRVGDDALLIDLRSGEILDVVYELFW